MWRRASFAWSIGFGCSDPVAPASSWPPGRAGLVLVAEAAADALVAAGAEGPLAVLRARAVAGEEHAADVRRHARVLERAQQLVDGVRAERVEHVGPVEGDAYGAVLAGAVVGQVGEVLEARHHVPGLRVEDLADALDRTHGARLSVRVRKRTAARDVVKGMALTGTYVPSEAEWVRNQVDEYEASNGEKGEHPARHRSYPDRGHHLRRGDVGQPPQEPGDEVERDGAYLAVASKGGAPENPVWYYNFVAAPRGRPAGRRREAHLPRARARRRRVRQDWWDHAVATWPTYAPYQEKTDRKIPLFLLER